ncbi:hypothetical protein KR009_005341 [Drosophila setifemur]|nr:hypothetical protein KR009_005341 [Drosophila setifemur]
MDTSEAISTCAEEQQQQQLHCSLSSVELESELEMEVESDLSLAFEREEEAGSCDELPAFEIRAFCPHGRTPSPIDDLNLSGIETPKQQPLQRHKEDPEEPHHNHPDFVALHEINAQISPPSDANESRSGDTNNLETIFEGVFLHTPPREKISSAGSGSTRCTPKRSRANLMELVAIGNRLHGGKENESPPEQSPTNYPT